MTRRFPSAMLLTLALVVSTAVLGAHTEIPAGHADHYSDPLPPDAVTRIGSTRFWCGLQGNQVAYSQDGRKLLAACWDGVFLYDAASGILPAGSGTSPALPTARPWPRWVVE